MGKPSFALCYNKGTDKLPILGEGSGSVVEHRTQEREVGVRNLPPPCCVLEQDTVLPESTGNAQEAVAPSRHD